MSDNVIALPARERVMSTSALKAMWDAFDDHANEGESGYFWPPDGPHIEDVHAELNRRGEGMYCAV